MGIRNDEYQTWESVKLYYLKSDGSVEEIALNGDVTGGPAKVSGAEQMDFSESFITLGNKTFWTLKSDIRRANQRLYCLV